MPRADYSSITPQQLKQIMPGLAGDAQSWATALNTAMANHQINTPLRQAAFLAQLSAETSDLRRLTEDLRYRAPTISRLKAARLHGFSPEALAADHQLFANVFYSGVNGNGDIASGDGYRYRGRGAIQLTGRGNYAAAGRAIGVDLVSNPDLVASDPDIAAKTAAWFFSQQRGIIPAADAGDISMVGRLVNGGSNGAKERAAAYTRALATLSPPSSH